MESGGGGVYADLTTYLGQVERQTLRKAYQSRQTQLTLNKCTLQAHFHKNLILIVNTISHVKQDYWNPCKTVTIYEKLQ